jgi:hypothetical protein
MFMDGLFGGMTEPEIMQMLDDERTAHGFDIPKQGRGNTDDTGRSSTNGRGTGSRIRGAAGIGGRDTPTLIGEHRQLASGHHGVAEVQPGFSLPPLWVRPGDDGIETGYLVEQPSDQHKGHLEDEGRHAPLHQGLVKAVPELR